jgi:hypothetical protein
VWRCGTTCRVVAELFGVVRAVVVGAATGALAASVDVGGSLRTTAHSPNIEARAAPAATRLAARCLRIHITGPPPLDSQIGSLVCVSKR